MLLQRSNSKNSFQSRSSSKNNISLLEQVSENGGVASPSFNGATFHSLPRPGSQHSNNSMSHVIYDRSEAGNTDTSMASSIDSQAERENAARGGTHTPGGTYYVPLEGHRSSDSRGFKSITPQRAPSSRASSTDSSRARAAQARLETSKPGVGATTVVPEGGCPYVQGSDVDLQEVAPPPLTSWR
eukprot:CAMPEP_0173458048 /NCGR_PEP_ID=MMETSP1357-20121228/58838_1 /TAXON_ID=77926 /ORGANISM="Hemiselmis rufescens, Strain PCC563" /LENGTH=184 /DNA_ID=CAMNT_0014425387 /DNA_START=66 /DNA_END=617 /DNA_ORIENTATION=-